MEIAKQIEFAPKNGDFVVLQDARSGSWEVGRWAAESDNWVQIDGKPLRIFPTHWVPVSGDAAGSENSENVSFLAPPIQAEEAAPKLLHTRFILAAFTATSIVVGGYTVVDLGSKGAGSVKNLSSDKILGPPARLKQEIYRERNEADVAARDGASPIASPSRPVKESNAALGPTDVIPNAQGLEDVTAGTPPLSNARRAPISAVPDDAVAGSSRPPAQPGQSQPTSTLSPADEARLIDRAEFLIKQSDFAGARLLLEHALDKGSARAAFTMAETYDWRMLRALQPYGVRGDTEKARELYELAAAAGIEKARDRLEALKSSAGN